MKKILAMLLAIVFVFSLVGCSASDYKKATATLEAGDYAAARSMFEALGDYKDSAELVNECDYLQAQELYNSGDLAATAELLETLGEYKDSAELLASVKDEMIEEALIGSWISGEVDFTDVFMEGLNDALAEEDEDASAFMDNFDVPAFLLKFAMDLTEDGTVSVYCDQESYAATADTLTEAFTAAFVTFFENTMEEEAAANGMTMDDVMSFLGVSTTEELIESAMGMTMDEFVTELLGEALSAVADIEASGVFSVEDGEVLLTIDDSTEKGVLDLASGELTLTGEGVAEEDLYMYPLVFTKK